MASTAVQIDIAPEQIGLRYPVDVGLVGRCRDVLGALLPRLARKADQGFLAVAQERMRHWRALMEKQATRNERPIKPQMITYHLNKLLEGGLPRSQELVAVIGDRHDIAMAYAAEARDARRA